MWQKFTERARNAVFFAQEEAAKYGEDQVNAEHLLLGLIREDDNIAIRILMRIGIDPRHLRSEIEHQISKSSGRSDKDMQLAPSAKRAIDLAYVEARRLNNNYIGTEHVLLGLIAENKSIAACTLIELGADLERTRKAVMAIQTGSTESAEASISKVNAMDNSMRGKDLVSMRDLSTSEIWKILDTAKAMKGKSLADQVANPILPGKTLAMIFEKPSLRTRVTFEVGMTQLGGHAIYIQPSDIHLGVRESVPDAARCLERWVDGIMARTFAHQTVVDLAKHADVPVINGLSDLEHPCQALADFLTIYEKRGKLNDVKLAYIGDGCNTCNSLMLLAAKVGAHMAVGCPEGYEPDSVVLTNARRDARESGSWISITNDPFEAVKGANVIYTDVWTSMGFENEREERLKAFQPYQVNQALVDAAEEDVIVLHCLPAHRGEEITDEVLDGPHSAAFDEAENRLHVQKAIMALLM